MIESEVERVRQDTVKSMVEQLCKNTDFDLLYAQKQALMNALETGAAVPKEAMEGLVNFLDHMGDLGEALGRFQYEGIDPPFPMEEDYVKKDITFAEEPQAEKKMQILCMEHEGDDGIRDFSILGVSEDRNELRKLMNAKIEKDEYGYIANNGVRQALDDIFETKFENGFVCYWISESEVLDKDQIQALLNTPEYDTSFNHADNLSEILEEALRRISELFVFDITDMDAAVESFLNDKAFQALTKNEDWIFDESHIPDLHVNRAIDYCVEYLADSLTKDTSFLAGYNGVKPFLYPENMREIVVDQIFDISRELRLSVSSPHSKAYDIMHDPSFRESLKQYGYGESDAEIPEGSDAYRKMVSICNSFVKASLEKEKKPSVDSMIKGAQLHRQCRDIIEDQTDLER